MSTATEELLLAASDVQIEAAAGNTPAVSIVAYTGGQMVVPGWGPLVIERAGSVSNERSNRLPLQRGG